MFLLVAGIVVFFAVTWQSINGQAQDLGQHLKGLEQQIVDGLPAPLAMVLQRSTGLNTSMIASYAVTLGRSVLGAMAAFVLASILVLYLLIEANQTYRWIRGFVPAELRPRFDRTASGARDVASAYIVANFATSVLAGLYTFAWLAALGVPAALVLAVLAFVCDFVPILGFFRGDVSNDRKTVVAGSARRRRGRGARSGQASSVVAEVRSLLRPAIRQAVAARP